MDDRGLKEHLFVDIFIKELNLAIECNGEQHYKANKFFYGGSFDFKKSQKRDELKKEWCKKNKISLAIFKFSDKLSYEFFNDTINKAIKENFNG